MRITYKSEKTIARFHKSKAFYRCVRGPVRSGKSSGCSVELMMKASSQEPNPKDKIRRTRWAVCRNTYRELNDTTLKTWLMWFPEEVFGPFNYGDMVHRIKINDLDIEVLFRAFDRPEHIKKLLSLELTGAWINEAREVPKAVIDMIGDRVGQYPPKIEVADGSTHGCSWGGVILDTNSPDDDHWWFNLESEPPKGWDFFVQPGALIEIEEGKFVPNPKAENVSNLNEGHDYYVKRKEGKTNSYIRVYYCNEFGFVEEGKRVHPEYSDSTHCAASTLVPSIKDEVVIGLDFGLTPAAALCSRLSNGQWWVFKELVTEDIGIAQFAEQILLPYINEHLADYTITVYGDTHGNTGSQNDKKTPGEIMEGLGIRVRMPQMGCGPTLRRESLAAPLSRLVDGKPGMLIDPSCKTIRKGLSSKFVYKRIQVVGDDRYQEKPDKNFWSHICEALEHAMVGAGEGKIGRKVGVSKPKSRTRVRAVRSGWLGN